MVIFDVSALRVEKVFMKSCTTAQGGSMLVLDEAESERTGKEILHRIPVPMAVIRQLQQRHKMSRYLKPVPTALVYYGDLVVAVERHPLGTQGEMTYEGLDGTTEWHTDSESNIMRVLEPLVMHSDREWFIDGKFIYTFPVDVLTSVEEGEYLSADGKFRAAEVTSLKLADLPNREKLHPVDRTCLAYVTEDGQFALTPPIWKDVAGVGKTVVSKVNKETNKEEKEERRYQFDMVDEYLSVNLNFALKAGKEIGELFDYEAIEPLQLPELMVTLSTVNLPNVANAVKSTFDCGMKFTHAISWLIGMSTRIDSLDSYIVVRSLLKYLTTKGIFRKSLFNQESVFKKGMNSTDVPTRTSEEAVQFVDDLPFNVVNELLTTRKAVNNSREGNIGTGMYAAE